MSDVTKSVSRIELREGKWWIVFVDLAEAGPFLSLTNVEAFLDYVDNVQANLKKAASPASSEENAPDSSEAPPTQQRLDEDDGTNGLRFT